MPVVTRQRKTFWWTNRVFLLWAPKTVSADNLLELHMHSCRHLEKYVIESMRSDTKQGWSPVAKKRLVLVISECWKGNFWFLMRNILLFWDTAISHSKIDIRIVAKNIAVHRCIAAALFKVPIASALASCRAVISADLSLRYISSLNSISLWACFYKTKWSTLNCFES